MHDASAPDAWAAATLAVQAGLVVLFIFELAADVYLQQMLVSKDFKMIQNPFSKDASGEDIWSSMAPACSTCRHLMQLSCIPMHATYYRAKG